MDDENDIITVENCDAEADTLYDAYSAMNAMTVLFRMEIAEKERLVDSYRAENRMLKEYIAACLTVDINKRVTSDYVRQRWKHYHDMKDELRSRIATDEGIRPDEVSWTDVKKESDKLFLAKER